MAMYDGFTTIFKWIQIILSICFKTFNLIYWTFKNKRCFRKLPGLQGNGHWFFGHTLEIKQTGNIDLLNRFPSFFKFSNGLWRDHISCHDPRLIKRVIKNSDRFVDHHPINTIIWRGPTSGTLQMGPKLKSLRKILNMCYGLQSKHYYIKTCKDACVSCIDNLGILENKSKILEIRSLLSGISSKLPYTIWFGKIDETIEKRIDNIYHCEFVPSENEFEYCFILIRKAVQSITRRQKMTKLHQDIYKRRRRCIMNGMGVKTDHQSILDKLIIMEMEGQISLSDEQITSLFVMNFTFNRTIANTFRWMIKCLAENIVCQSKIRDEIMQMKVNGSYSNDELPLEKLEYLNMFVCEVLRLHPLKMTTRIVTNSFEFDGYIFPVGTLVDIDLNSLHRHPLFWTSPEKFIPERFSTENQNSIYTYLPFSAGPRMCPAKNFILVMIRTFLINFVEKFHFDADIANGNGEDIQLTRVTARAADRGH